MSDVMWPIAFGVVFGGALSVSPIFVALILTKPPKLELVETRMLGHDRWMRLRHGKREFEVAGGSTVWHLYPCGKRLSARYERAISDLEQGLKWKKG